MEGYPIRTFQAGRYTGGYSDHLPVFLDFENKNPNRRKSDKFLQILN